MKKDKIRQHLFTKKAAKSKLLLNSKRIENNTFVNQLVQAMPIMVAILNEEGQVIFSNNRFLDKLNKKTTDEVLGMKISEAFSCIYAEEHSGSCGSSENCYDCGIIGAIVESRLSKQATAKDCKFTSRYSDKNSYFDYKVTASPFVFDGNTHTIVAIEDIGDIKRKSNQDRMLQKILNTADGIHGHIGFLKGIQQREEMDPYLEDVSRLAYSLIDEVKYHEELAMVERGQHQTQIEIVDSVRMIYDILHHLEHNQVAEGKRFIIDVNSNEFNLATDVVLLKRVVANMLINALEATETKGSVKLGCKSEGDHGIFWVMNYSFIPEEFQHKIFQRSFSTKDENRGLGTYAIKLFTEEYLKGDVYFESSEEKGSTIFSVKIPLTLPA